MNCSEEWISRPRDYAEDIFYLLFLINSERGLELSYPGFKLEK